MSFVDTRTIEALWAQAKWGRRLNEQKNGWTNCVILAWSFYTPANMTKTTTCLLDLPPELIAHIITFLPLSGALIFRLQTCKTVRLNPFLGRFKIPGPTPHTLSLSQWQVAALELQELGLVSSRQPDREEDESSDQPTFGRFKPHRKPPALPPLPTTQSISTSDFPTWSNYRRSQSNNSTDSRNRSSLSSAEFTARAEALDNAFKSHVSPDPVKDGQLFRRIVMFLGFITASTSPFPEAALINGRKMKEVTALPKELRPWIGSDHLCSTGPTLRCITLISWYGVSGVILVELLRTCPEMRDVKLVIKTERFDSGRCLVCV